MDLIDRNALLNRYQEICNGTACMDCPFNKDGCAFEKLILESAVVDAEPVRHGKWMHKEYKMANGESVGYFVCSECGHATWNEKDNHYCFNCGVLMDEANYGINR